MSMLNAARARRQQQSGWATQADRLLGTGYRDIQTILPAACGDLLEFNELANHLPNAIIDPIARPRIAALIAAQWAARCGHNDDNLLRARMVGELTVSWDSKYPRGADGMAQASAELSRLLDRVNVPNADLQTAVRDIYAACRAALGGGTVPRAEMGRYTTTPIADQQVAKSFLEFVIRAGHTIPDVMISDNEAVPAAAGQPAQTFREIWHGLKAYATADPNLPDVQMQLADDIQVPYVGMTIRQKLGFWECMTYASLEAAQTRTLGAAATFIVAACKGTNETENYMEKRRLVLETEFPHLHIDAIFNSDVIKHFVDLYMNQNIEVNTLYRALMPIYSSYQGGKLQCLGWIIEQAIGHNCTSLVAFADASVEQAYRPVQILLRKLSEGQWQQFVRACYILIRNPWGQMRKPAVPAAMFKDIANYGRYARSKQDAKFAPYAGGFLPNGELTKKQIEEIYKMCRDQASTATAQELALENELARLLPGIHISEDDGYFYIHDGTDNPINLQAIIDHMNAEDRRARAAAAAAPPQGGGQQDQAGNPQAGNQAAGAGVGQQAAQDAGANPFYQGAPAGGAGYGAFNNMAVLGAALTEEERNALRDEERRRLNAMRAAWGQRERMLPRSAIRIGMDGVINLIQRRMASDPRYQAIITLLSQIRIAVSQEVLTPWSNAAGQQIALRSRYRTVAEPILAAVRAFGLNPNEIIPVAPGDDVQQEEQPYEAATMDADAQWARPARATI